MTLQQRITDCLNAAVNNNEAAGISVMIRRNCEEILFTSAGCADRAKQLPIRRDNLFRLFSQSKPITAAAVVLLMERGLIDAMDPVEKFLDGFRNQKVLTPEGLVPAVRPATVMDMLGMVAGVSYPGEDEAGQYAAELFDENNALILAGGGMSTIEFANRIGQLPLAFHPGQHFRYSTCADVLGAVVEVVSGKPFDQFLKEELFEPLSMKDTDFWVPAEKWDRLVTCYKRADGELIPFTQNHLNIGVYDRRPAFLSGGAGLVSTLDDYAAFTDMLHNGGEYNGKRILSPASVRFLTSPQLGWQQQKDMWESLDGFSYGKLMRVCIQPGRYLGFACLDEYGWDGWLGTYFANLPNEKLTIMLMQNVTDAGTTTITRKVRNLILSALSNGEI
ncbi:MAG: beta-lactamase family protein [Clostridiales bacterium]|nr:beta-lactamase family protein [Clostridiales bacterium]